MAPLLPNFAAVPPRPDRVLYPESGFMKSDAIAYYKAVAKFILPHLRNRPVSFKRYVDTVRGESFWEKDAPSFTPDWVRRVPVPRRGEGGGDIEYIVINDARTLNWVVDVGGIELHPFLHLATNIELATQIVFDLDPGDGADILACARVALLLRDALAALKLESFPKVSGSKGIQVYVPIRGTPHAATEPFARVLAEELARRHPDLIVAKMTKALRANKVFIDWSQNADYKTTIGVYSLRAKGERPYVSMPVRWAELARPRKLSWEPEEAVARLRKVGDLFAPVLRVVRASGLPPVPKAGLRPTPHGRTLPKPSSQSGKRLFLLVRTEIGNELWTDMHGHFRRWILREGGDARMAMPAGDFPIARAWYRGEVPKAWKDRVTIEEAGAYELIEGSYASHRFDLWFNGKVLSGEWILEKAGTTSWRLFRRPERSGARSSSGSGRGSGRRREGTP
jgi:bifunctional non-homologous end joining protein LigD